MKSNTGKQRLGMPDLRMSWFCSLVSYHWQELMESNSRCGISDHAIATLSLMQLQMAPELDFQAALNMTFSTFWHLHFVTQTTFFQKCLLCVCYWFIGLYPWHSLLLSIRSVYGSSILLHRFFCCRVNSCSSRESFVMVNEGRIKCCCVWENLHLSLTNPFLLWISWHRLPWGMLTF